MLIPYNVTVSAGANRTVATIRVVATDKRRAVVMAEQSARVFHNIPPQVALIGVVR